MKCTWHDDTDCQEEAIERWTEIPYVDPYCGPFYASAEEEPLPHIDHVCAIHSKIGREIWIEATKGDVVRADHYLSQVYKIEKL